jgi:2-dehydro-3-deoxygalactonokinase
VANCERFLSCDWGTSSFRLRLVQTDTLTVVAQTKSASGVKSFNEPGLSKDARADACADFVRAQLRALAQKHSFLGAPLIVSGMATSSIGWKELPYAMAPLGLTGDDLHIQELVWDAPAEVSHTFLVSGIASDLDMMRGEECQIVGIFAQLENERYKDRAVLVLPGTHSKHVFIENGAITDWKTFMTGELYEILSKHSVLASTVCVGEFEDLDGFRQGLAFVRERGLAASLFKVRARNILKQIAPTANAGFLSGVLIGSEVAELERHRDRPIIIASTDRLGMLYSVALGPPRNCDAYGVDLENATIAAHRLLIQRFEK